MISLPEISLVIYLRSACFSAIHDLATWDQLGYLLEVSLFPCNTGQPISLPISLLYTLWTFGASFSLYEKPRELVIRQMWTSPNVLLKFLSNTKCPITWDQPPVRPSESFLSPQFQRPLNKNFFTILFFFLCPFDNIINRQSSVFSKTKLNFWTIQYNKLCHFILLIVNPNLWHFSLNITKNIDAVSLGTLFHFYFKEVFFKFVTKL